MHLSSTAPIFENRYDPIMTQTLGIIRVMHIAFKFSLTGMVILTID